jgi:hypothetical protein
VDLTGRSPAAVAVGGVVIADLLATIAVTFAIGDCLFYDCGTIRELLAGPHNGKREARKGRDREGDDTRGLTPEQIDEKFKGRKTPEEIKRLKDKAEKFRGTRNVRKRNKSPLGTGGGLCPADKDDEDSDESDSSE